MNPIEIKLNELPVLPFEKILSYLSLEDRIKSRAVSLRWCQTIDSFRVKSLCYSMRPSQLIYGKNRLVNGAYAQNFIHSPRFESFICIFNTFGQLMLAKIKRLHLCELKLTVQNKPVLSQMLELFGHLEELGLFQISFDLDLDLRLNLPMLIRLQLEGLHGIEKLTVKAPRLLRIQLLDYSLPRLVLVHPESVETLISASRKNMEMKRFEMKKLKNLKFLHTGYNYIRDSMFLISLKQLKEIHLKNATNVPMLFEQKQRYRRTDLKIYLNGFLLNGPNDTTVYKQIDWTDPSRLADEIPLLKDLFYCWIESVAQEVTIAVLNRLTDLDQIVVDSPVQDTKRFLDILKNSDKITKLEFRGDHPQDLFDRLPEQCAIQALCIDCKVSNFEFLLKLKSLNYLNLSYPVNGKFIQRALEELEFLRWFYFEYKNKRLEIVVQWPKLFQVRSKNGLVIQDDVASVIRFVTGKSVTKSYRPDSSGFMAKKSFSKK